MSTTDQEQRNDPKYAKADEVRAFHEKMERDAASQNNYQRGTMVLFAAGCGAILLLLTQEVVKLRDDKLVQREYEADTRERLVRHIGEEAAARPQYVASDGVNSGRSGAPSPQSQAATMPGFKHGFNPMFNSWSEVASYNFAAHGCAYSGSNVIRYCKLLALENGGDANNLLRDQRERVRDVQNLCFKVQLMAAEDQGRPRCGAWPSES